MVTQPQHYVLALRITRYNDLCIMIFLEHQIGAQSFCIRWEIYRPPSNIFSLYSSFTCIASYLISLSLSFSSVFWFHDSVNFSTEVPRALIFKHCQEPRYSWRTLLQTHAVCTPLHTRCIHSTTFIFSFDLSSTYATPFKQLLPLSSTHT